jgi:hypothetical protein
MYQKQITVPATVTSGADATRLDSVSTGITGKLVIECASNSCYVLKVTNTTPVVNPTAGVVKSTGFLLVAGNEPLSLEDSTSQPDPSEFWFASTTGADVRVIDSAS